jgi:hypothetical protein
VTRVPALTGRYEFLSFREPAEGRAWLEAVREKVPSAKNVAGTMNLERRWVICGVHLEWTTRISLIRQFEFIQNVWVNDPNFHELGNEHDPMIG